MSTTSSVPRRTPDMAAAKTVTLSRNERKTADARERAPAVGVWDRSRRKEGDGQGREALARERSARACERIRGEARRGPPARRRRPPLPGSLRPGAPQPVGVGGAHAAAPRGAAHDQRAPRGAGLPGHAPALARGPARVGPRRRLARAGPFRGNHEEPDGPPALVGRRGRQGFGGDAGQRPLRHRGPQGARGYRDGLVLDRAKLAQVRDERVRLSLELQAAFGLRREEAIKFRVADADRGDRIALRPSWCKGGGPGRAGPDRRPARAARPRARVRWEGLADPAGGKVRAADAAVRARHAPRRDPEVAPAAARLRTAPVPGAGGLSMRRGRRQAGTRHDGRRAATRPVGAADGGRELGHARIDIASTYLG